MGIRLGKDEKLRQEISWKLRKSKQTAPLWNAKQFTREMEKAYEGMWQKYIEGGSCWFGRVSSIIRDCTNLEIDSMAKLPPETLTTIFNLQQRLVELIDEAKAAEYNLFEEYGETEETLPELEQLQNVTERLRNPYSRLYTLALAITEAQPMAPAAMVNLLERTLAEAPLTADAAEASIIEIKRTWSLP